MSGQHGNLFNANDSLAVPGRKEEASNGSDFIFYICDPCEAEGHRFVAFGFCSDCNHFLCEKCYSVHCRPLPTRHHQLLDKDHMPKHRPRVSINIQVIDETCETHSGKIVEYFCEDHETIGCSVCITLDHKACDGVRFIPEMKVDKDKIKVVMKDLSTLNCKAKHEQERVKQSLALDEDSFDIAVQDARTFCTKTKSHIDFLQTKFEDTTEREREALVESKSLEIDDLEKTIQQTELLSNDMSCYQSANKEASLFIAMKKAEHVIQSNSYDNNRKDLELNYVFLPHEDLCKIQGNLESLGAIDIEFKNAVKGGGLDESNLPGINIEKLSSQYATNATEDTSDCYIVGIVPLYDPIRDIIADAGNNRIKVIKAYSNTLTTSLSIPSRPFAMAKFSGNKVCVTMPERKEIVIITVSKLFMRDTISRTRSIACEGKCYGIAVNDVHEEIVVVCEYEGGKVAIDILDFHGKKLRYFTNNKVNDEPRYIEVTLNNIYTLDINDGVLTKRTRVSGAVESVCTVEHALQFTIIRKQYIIVVTRQKPILRVYNLNLHELKAKGELCNNAESILCVQKESNASDSLNIGFSDGYVQTYRIKE